MVKIKSETYKGCKVTFEKMHKGFVGAKVPSRTSQFIGIGKGKRKAFEDAKKSINNFKSKCRR